MTDSTGFLIYAALYRLTVLAVGALGFHAGSKPAADADNADAQ